MLLITAPTPTLLLVKTSPWSLEILPDLQKHIQTQFSLQHVCFWSITQPEMLCHVSVL